MSIDGNLVTVTVTGDMMARDEIIVTYHNVKVQEVASRETEAAQLTVTDSIVGSEGMYDTSTVIMVASPVLSQVSVAPLRFRQKP